MKPDTIGIFDEVRTYPDPAAGRQYSALVGLDETKSRLLKESILLLRPEALVSWTKRHHQGAAKLLSHFKNRPPLFLFAGDVGTGKTALAESFGDAVAREVGFDIALYALSLTARGTGAVGQMTALLSAAFAEVRQAAQKSVGKGGVPTGGVILLVDEADALAQSREAAQMHHEDRAGVNALIRGVDDLAANGLPALVVMCTNRLEAIDPAVRRRAAATFTFGRPNDTQRNALLTEALEEIGFGRDDIRPLVQATGPTDGRGYGYTYSDLTQRLLPSLVLEAFPEDRITPDLALGIARKTWPTPPFRSEVEVIKERKGM